ncbi:hypothetical protein OHS71_02365 [Streptomyces sp. NBC_00377]|uniref:hypothetical protein n=1 Tax=unclassified Streptomyces TaxID=2593676 RepID=UPI002E2425F5|nr:MULTISPECIES: hypothetical protein [unclassified Streptomyces]
MVHTIVGLLLAVCGAAVAVFGPTFAAKVGSRAGQRFEGSNTVAFRLIGAVLAVLGVLYAVGVVG